MISKVTKRRRSNEEVAARALARRLALVLGLFLFLGSAVSAIGGPTALAADPELIPPLPALGGGSWASRSDHLNIFGSTNPSLRLDPVGCTTYPYPYLQNVTRDSIVVMWQTCSKEVSRLRFRPLGAESWTEISDSSAVTIHELQIEGLDAAKVYEYQVSLDGTGQWMPETAATFRAAPGLWEGYRVAAYGDSRSNPERHAQVADSILAGTPAIVFNTGDLTIQGREHKYWGPEFFEPAASLMASTPMYPILGNHEYGGPERFWYFDMFSLPGNEEWYAISYGCTRFIVLNSNADRAGVSFAPGSEQYTWLEDELQSPDAEAARWQFVLFHHPPFTSGSHLGKEQPTEKYLVPLFEEHGVDLVLNGHSHQFERSYKDGIYYIVTGGGGAKLDNFPNVDLNPYSQVRISDYHHVTLDIDCVGGTVEYNAWDTTGKRIDGPIVLQDGSVPAHRQYVPLALLD